MASVSTPQNSAPPPVLRPGKFQLAIGSVIFSSEETPATITGLGAGKQQVVSLDLPGGGRVVQDFGNSAADLKWSGKFFGPNIEPRVAQLRAYRISGQPQTLSFKKERYQVKITDFDPGYRGAFNAYTIALVVIKDLNGAFAVSSPASVDQQVAALQDAYMTANTSVQSIDPVGSLSFQQQILNLQATLAQYAPLAQNLVPGSGPILGAVSAAIGAVQTYQSGIPPTAAQIPYVLNMLSALQSTGANVQPAQSSLSITTLGGDLFSVAAMQYGDVSQAFDLASINGLTSPILSSKAPSTIIVPAAQQ